MRVTQLWRYPVKSVGGERLDEVAVGAHGFEGDRSHGIVDLATGLVLTARRAPNLLSATAAWTGDGVVIRLDGQELADDAVLSEWLGRDVALRRAGTEGGTYENPADAEAETDWQQWQGPPDAWHDSARTRVSLVSQATLGAWDVRRFRPNVVVDGCGQRDEDALVGRSIGLGTTRLVVGKPVERCVMVTRPQPAREGLGALARDMDVLRTIHREHAGNLAVGALVEQPGLVTIGDELLGA